MRQNEFEKTSEEKSKGLKRLYPDRKQEVDILARTIWGEARGEPLRGQEAIACVIMNRVAKAEARGGHWWGNDVISVCKKPYQFSCWNADDPNYEKLLAADSDEESFRLATRIAKRALRGTLTDRTQGATHYHAKSITPWWARGRESVCDIGNHKFYRHIG